MCSKILIDQESKDKSSCASNLSLQILRNLFYDKDEKVGALKDLSQDSEYLGEVKSFEIEIARRHTKHMRSQT